MAMMTWLADVLRRAGLPVAELSGWQTRGHGSMAEVLGVLTHHTAGAASGNYPSQNIVVNGRSDLSGPLANLGLARDGTWIVIAAGQAWHAGTGSISWCPANQGNSHLIGVEAESVGTRDDWTAAQRESYPRGVAALLRYLGLPASRVIGHKEWAPTRKIDPAFWDMGQFRADAARWMNNPAPPAAPKGLFMTLSTAEEKEILEAARSVLFGQAGVRSAGRMAAAISELYTAVGGVNQRLDALAARPTAQVDTAPIVAAVIDAVARAGVAQQVLDGLAARLSAKPV